MENKNVAILFIATGKYILFWKDFYEACEKYFLINHNKTYFLYTDAEQFAYSDNKNVKKIYQKQLPWPYPTLMRFDMFEQNKQELKNFDYIYFINGTMLPVKEITEEIFPTSEQGLMVTQHPGFYKRPRTTFTYDINPKSLAYIPENDGQYYFMGGFNGGTSTAFIKLIEDLNNNIKKDLENDVIALWHDESHLNKYMLNKNSLILTPLYGFPEDMPFNQENLKIFKDSYKIIIKNKAKLGGAKNLRGIQNINCFTKLFTKIKKIFN